MILIGQNMLALPSLTQLHNECNANTLNYPLSVLLRPRPMHCAHIGGMTGVVDEGPMMRTPLAAGRTPKRCNISRTVSLADALNPHTPSTILQHSYHHVAAKIVEAAFLTQQLRLSLDRCAAQRIAAMSDTAPVQHPR
jgi:hypothetical protein